MTYAIIIERADDGSFLAYVPDLPGCTSSADTEAEVRESIRDAIRRHIQTLKALGREILRPGSIVDTVDVAVA